jgi:hypothetical protein
MSKQRMAGGRLLDFLATPLGMALLDGTLGTGMVTIPLALHQDAPLPEEALQVGGAMTGAIGTGVVGHLFGGELAERLMPGSHAVHSLPPDSTLRQRLLQPMPRSRLVGTLIADALAGLGMYAGWQGGTALAHSAGLDRDAQGNVVATLTPDAS